MKKKNSLIILLFMIGLIVFIFPHLAQWINEYLQKEKVEEFLEMNISQEEVDKIFENAKVCNEEIYLDSEVFRDPFGDDGKNLEKFKECLGLANDEMFGALEIPRLKLMAPIYLGATDEILDKGVGQVEGSSIPIGGRNTHTVLAGHRGMPTKAMFRDLDQLKENDQFYIHTVDGTLTYEVYKQRVIYPYETESLEIQENEDLATLLTCHPYRFNYQRLLIHGKRVE